MTAYDDTNDHDHFGDDYDFLDEEGPDAHDIARAEAMDDTAACPVCNATVHEEAQQCPACGNWITPRVGSRSQSAVWLVIVAAVLLSFLLIMLR